MISLPTICEICGAVEDNEEESIQSSEPEHLLHVCPNCMKDRQVTEQVWKN